jgi:septal ring factor EnvC (AmiA/AmiB activator)
MRRIRLTCLGALLLLACLPADEEKPDREKLVAINSRIQEINEKLNRIRGEKTSILNDVYKIELESEALTIALNRFDLLLAETEGDIRRKETEKTGLEKKIEASRQNLQRIVRVLYKMGDMGYAKLFVTLRNFDQLFRNYYLITTLIDSKFDQIKEIKSDMIRLAKVERELRSKAAQLGKLKNEKNVSLDQLITVKREKLTLIDRINKERDIHAQVLAELKEEAENLNRTLDQHISRAGDSLMNFKTLKGKLAWPAEGKIISSFGKKKSRRFDTYTINNGIEISPSSSCEVTTVLDGEVVFSDYFRGYGNLMIIQHARNFHTLYGHCEKFVKAKGDRIRQGEVIALAGSSGTTAAKTLYFEIRESLKPTDPLKWLRKR